MIFIPLYIDPGTGSALFSIVIGLAAVSYFLFRTVFLKIKVFLFRQKDASLSQQKYVIYAEEKRYWPFFEPVLAEFESRQIEVLYLTSSEDDPVFSSQFKFIKGKFIGKGNKSFAYLNFLSADFVLATTPDLDVLQWKRSKGVKHYCHMLHMVSGSVTYRLFSLDFYDSIILSGENEIPEIRYLENLRRLPAKQLVVVGNTFLDRYNEILKGLPIEKNHPFTVLVSPSWGASGLLKIYGERLLDPLAGTGWRIIVRPHPQSVIAEKALLDSLTERYRDNRNIEWDYHHENIYSLSKSDIMISDFSGIIYDYIFLFDKPVLLSLSTMDLRPYDAHNLPEEPSYFKISKEVGIELNEANFTFIKDVITDSLQNAELHENRLEAKRIMWQYQGESGKRIVDFMVETVSKEDN